MTSGSVVRGVSRRHARRTARRHVRRRRRARRRLGLGVERRPHASRAVGARAQALTVGRVRGARHRRRPGAGGMPALDARPAGLRRRRSRCCTGIPDEAPETVTVVWDAVAARPVAQGVGHVSRRPGAGVRGAVLHGRRRGADGSTTSRAGLDRRGGSPRGDHAASAATDAVADAASCTRVWGRREAARGTARLRSAGRACSSRLWPRCSPPPPWRPSAPASAWPPATPARPLRRDAATEAFERACAGLRRRPDRLPRTASGSCGVRRRPLVVRVLGGAAERGDRRRAGRRRRGGAVGRRRCGASTPWSRCSRRVRRTVSRWPTTCASAPRSRCPAAACTAAAA